jgi:hypothetical protein
VVAKDRKSDRLSPLGPKDAAPELSGCRGYAQS